MVGGRKKVAAVTLITIVSVAVAVWMILSRPARPVLTEEEVRILITEHPSRFHFEVKPEMIEFLSFELVPIEESPLAGDINKRELPEKVWVVEYECEGRAMGICLPEEYDPPLFTRQFVRVVIDAYTGQEISFHAEDVE